MTAKAIWRLNVYKESASLKEVSEENIDLEAAVRRGEREEVCPFVVKELHFQFQR